MFHTPLEMRRNNECVYRFLNTNAPLGPFSTAGIFNQEFEQSQPISNQISLEKYSYKGWGGGFLDYSESLRGKGNVLTNNN